VHSQAILRVVDDEGVVTEDEFIEAESDQAEYEADVADGVISSMSDDQKNDARRRRAGDRSDARAAASRRSRLEES
jgi:preprotein translocase subunit YajC